MIGIITISIFFLAQSTVAWVLLALMFLIFSALLLYRRISAISDGAIKNKIFNIILIIPSVLFIVIVLRIFYIEVFVIRNGSMEGTLLPQDIVLVNKLNYGPRILVPFINKITSDKPLENYFNKKTKKTLTFDYIRLNGFTKIYREDILVFTRLQNDNHYIKRCIGLPGETLEIRKGIVICNKNELKLPINARIKRRLWINNIRKLNNQFKSLNIPIHSHARRIKNTQYIDITLSQAQYFKIKDLGCVDSINYWVGINKGAKQNTFPHNELFQWTHENFGPVIIPKEGMTILLTPKTFILYKDVITNEDKTIISNNGIIESNGIRLQSYTFKDDYYFMMGDNRHNSRDSREWGFVPHTKIIGKVTIILLPKKYAGLKRRNLFSKIES